MGAGVEVLSVSKAYGTGAGRIAALDDVTLGVPAGSVVAVTGPSGSGKSTLLHLVGAMDTVDSGSITVGEVEVTRLSRRAQSHYRRTIGFVFQRFHLLPALGALDNVAAPLLPYRTSFDKFARAGKLLDAVGLAGREDALPSQLSGGEQQRVAIARALINEPAVLLADEPTGNLDTATGSEIVGLLLQLRDAQEMTVLVVTHNPAVAARCDRVVRLQDGQAIDDVDVPAGVGPLVMLERITRVDAHG